MQNKSFENSLNKDILKYMLVKILPALSGVLTIYLLTRMLSASLYSNYVFVMATAVLFGQLISGWTNSSVIYFYTDFVKNNTEDTLKVNVILLQLVLFFLGALGFTIVCFMGLKDLGVLILSLLFMFWQIVIGMLYSFLQAERRVFVQIRSTIIQSVIQIVGVVACYFWFKENISIVFFVLFLSYFFASNYVMYSDNVYKLILSKRSLNLLDLVITKKLLSYGLPVCIWFFASQFYTIGDRIMLKYFNINDLVGNYAAFRDLFVGLSGFITMPLLMASHPVILQMAKDNVSKTEIENLISNNIRLLISLFTIIFIGLFFLGDIIMLQLVGKEFVLSTPLMFLVMLSVFLGTLSMYIHKGLETTGNTILMAKIAISVSLTSFILSVFTLSNYGVYAACIISVLSQVLYILITYYYSKKTFKINIEGFFLAKHILFALLCKIITHFLLFNNFDILIRSFLFIVFSSIIIFSSKEIKSFFNIINK